MPDNVTFAEITPAQWKALARQRLVFGHQSVGRNIVAGLTEVLTAHPEIGVRVVQGLPTDDQPGLYHENVGRNRDVASKTTHFDALADSAQFDAAVLKFCYVDVGETSNADSMFVDYQRWVDNLQRRHPTLRIIHATLPLTSLDSPKERILSFIRGQRSARELNVVRHTYNEKLRAAYAGRAPIFDIAALESTRPDGSRVTFRSKGQDIPYLNPDITYDGGHLNEMGRQRAAEQFLAVLASQHPPE